MNLNNNSEEKLKRMSEVELKRGSIGETKNLLLPKQISFNCSIWLLRLKWDSSQKRAPRLIPQRMLLSKPSMLAYLFILNHQSLICLLIPRALIISPTIVSKQNSLELINKHLSNINNRDSYLKAKNLMIIRVNLLMLKISKL